MKIIKVKDEKIRSFRVVFSQQRFFSIPVISRKFLFDSFKREMKDFMIWHPLSIYLILLCTIGGIFTLPNSNDKLTVLKSCLTTKLNGISLITSTSSQYGVFSQGQRPSNSHKPLAIIMPKNEAEVSLIVKCALKANVRPVPRGGGHSYENLSSQNGSLIIDMTSMQKVTVIQVLNNGMDGIATVEAGARLGNVYTELWKQGQFNFNAGTCPTVGIGGHISGGGYGMCARLRGLAADKVISMRVVLYDGRVLEEVSSKKNKDLFWALR